METEIEEAGRSECAFAMRALHHVVRADACRAGAGASNLAISPLSIHAALVLLGAGARGATLDEIVAVLGPAGGHAHALLASRVALRVLADADGENGGPKLRFANGVWVDDAAARLKADYTAVVAEHYCAQARMASFSTMPDVSRHSINQWFSAATAGLIKDFLPPGSVSTLTRCILANALYFKGVWETKFDAQLTQPRTFHLPDYTEVLVPFMSSRESQYIDCRTDWKVLKLRYACGRGGARARQFAMYVYLPNQRHGLYSMLQKLASNPALLSMDLRRAVPVGDFRVPRFTISYKTEATGLLQGLGLRLPFDEKTADLSEMLESTKTADGMRFFVSNVYHQSLVEVNEEGTVAAAATMFGCLCAASPSMFSTPVPLVDFVADHPFMYLIKEELSGVVVFGVKTEIAEAGTGEVAFAMRALHHLVRADACRPGAGASNLAISPLSIHAALVLLGAGARGATLDEIVAVLGPAGGHAHALLASRVALRVLADADGENGGPKVRFANGVWVDDAAARLKADYTAVVAEHYCAQARMASFSTMPDVSRHSINQWFSAATAGVIKDFLPSGSVSAATRCILANALYFKGVWDTKFDAQLTEPRTFHLPANREVLVPFMSSRLSQYIACCPDWKVLKLPYACGGHDESRRRQFAMYIYLPNQQNGLQSMVQKLAASPELLKQVDMDLLTKVLVGDFRVPKFTISYKAEATGLLQGLGLHLPFDHQAADFSEMLEPTNTADHRGFVVSNVYHQSFVEVNEEGTEAAAATMFGCYGSGCSSVVRPPVPVVDFVADHPFMYLIKEELTGVVVFAGQVVNPSL
ncbi:hypothetical protein QYE76_057865 [Lolium multiflorum]|uniref:Serpin domain-containing protein n=1 Tax=Lolium multiflorum TaxID=4521 RepID=A0AAD8T4B6_LOLMU|nr:hypothetical protein QYE76_057865 [Lolium multiflorum]